jgi:hypothetical protein
MKKLISLTEGDLHRILKESLDSVLNEAGFFGGLRRAYNMGNTIDYLTSSDTRKTTQRGVDRDRAKTGINGQNLGLSGYHTKNDTRKMQADADAITRSQKSSFNSRLQNSYRQPIQQQQGNIYTQTIQALNNGNRNFFQGNKNLQGVLSSLYNNKKITYNEYDKGLQWIGLGYRYSSGQNDGLY